jgi:hypothetical protein
MIFRGLSLNSNKKTFNERNQCMNSLVRPAPLPRQSAYFSESAAEFETDPTVIPLLSSIERMPQEVSSESMSFDDFPLIEVDGVKRLAEVIFDGEQQVFVHPLTGMVLAPVNESERQS